MTKTSARGKHERGLEYELIPIGHCLVNRGLILNAPSVICTTDGSLLELICHPERLDQFPVRIVRWPEWSVDGEILPWREPFLWFSTRYPMNGHSRVIYPFTDEENDVFFHHWSPTGSILRDWIYGSVEWDRYRVVSMTRPLVKQGYLDHTFPFDISHSNSSRSKRRGIPTEKISHGLTWLDRE